MGLFTEKAKFKFKKIPSAPEQKQARGYLQSLYQEPLEYPTLEIAGLTPTEQMVQGALPDYFAESEGAYNQARNYYADILSGKYDPLTSPYYQGMRTNIEARKKAGIQGVVRAGQTQGMLKSGPTAALGAETGRMYDADIAALEGQLLEAERSRMGGAAAAIPSLENQRLARMAGISDLAMKERLIQQARNQAAFEAAINDMLAPYLYNAQIASALLNEPRYVGVQTGGGITDLGMFMQMGAEVAGPAIAAGMAGASDVRLKENIAPIGSALDKVRTLKGYTYNYTFDSSDKRNAGVMAQDLEKVLPEAVLELNGIKYVKYDAVIGLLVSALNELAECVQAKGGDLCHLSAE